jgi:hypothetical protein
MGNRVQVNGGNSALQGTQGGPKAKEGQFGDKGLSSASRISPDKIQAQLGSGISGSNPLTSRWTSVGLTAAGVVAAAGAAVAAAGLVAGAAAAVGAAGAAGAAAVVAATAGAGILAGEKIGLALSRVLRGKDEALNEAPNPELERLRQTSEGQILEGATKKAFNDASLSDIRAKLKAMPLSEAREVWQTIANEVAVDCFDADGHVNVAKLETWMTFLGNAENFKKAPLRFIPHAELMRSQMYTVCESLRDNRNGARARLDAAASITVGTHGRSILDTMSKDRQTPLRSYEAILASLLVPPRKKQEGLLVNMIYSLFNAEIRNHPERLIETYTQMLSSDKITFPSGYEVQQQTMVDGSITADLQNGGRGRDAVFKNITGGDRTKIDQQIKMWRQEGIEYTLSTNPVEKYKLRMPVCNMNDMLFAHFFQASNFGNSRIDDHGDYGTGLIYPRHLRVKMKYQSVIQADKSNLPSVTATLKAHAEAQKKLGYQYIHVGTLTTTATIVGGYNHSGHAENIDINALLALDLSTMEPGKAYSIGDRNWRSWDMSQDVPRLAVRKTNGTLPIFEFGTLEG